MSSIIAEKYADLLTMEDVVELFKLLEKKVGNKVEAAKICGLERKTTYGWDTTKEIRLRTKKKVLTALIENLTEETLDFITERSVDTSADVLRTYLSALYERAMDEREDPLNFLRLASRFEETKQKYAGMIVDRLEVEVGNMSTLFPEKATELGTTFKVSPINVLKLSELSILVPSLIKTISSTYPYIPDSEIAKFFNLPSDFILTLSVALHENYIAIRTPIAPLKISPSPYEGNHETAGTIELHLHGFPEAVQPEVWTKKPILGE